MNMTQITPRMRLTHAQSVLHWMLPMRHSVSYGPLVRTALRATVQAAKAARNELRTAA